MKIAGFEKLSLQDYPEHISCIVFTQGCNFRCPFCQNSTLIPFNALDNIINEDEVFNYLMSRKNVINGITITGGEPTMQEDLKDFIIKLKQIGIDVKLDTNGMNYSLLKKLIDNHLVDYVAMDIKNTFDKYAETSGIPNINTNNISNSINLLKQNKVPYEFRTTVTNEHHNLQDVLEIIKLVGDSRYYIQNFKNSDCVLNKNLTKLTEEKLDLWNAILKQYANVTIRGITKED